MNKNWIESAWVFVLIIVSLPLASVAQEGVKGQANDVVLKNLKQQIKQNYAFKDCEDWIVESIARNERLGLYKDLDEKTLGSTLTKHLRDWTKDKHFMVAHLPQMAAQIEQSNDADDGQPSEPTDDPNEKAANFGVRKSEMIDDEIGLIKLDRIAFSPGTLNAFQKALASLTEARALILDLRDNHGGSPGNMLTIASCFFPREKEVEFATRYWRPDDRLETIAVLKEQAGVRFYDHPIVILTSKDTRSAAEALAYHLRSCGGAFVVGEKSSGGAHPASMVSLGNGFVALIPMGYVTSAKTGTDWEGRGVPVDLECPADQAEAKGIELAKKLLQFPE